ncbi:hypothetical protein K2173_024618 [Erythroxylum novogranatense]|uniref:Uncharacterized protein n=1 Tax=Erythroxylum novogranatense TaxID=1862640 RepID=A0AAV8SUV9_9ROSI|nr:hypothetical protein K2173_024618 [Erythroxylum novogranatense]
MELICLMDQSTAALLGLFYLCTLRSRQLREGENDKQKWLMYWAGKTLISGGSNWRLRREAETK